MQDLKKNEIAEMLQLAIDQDQEIKAAILNDRKAVTQLLQAVIIDEIKQDLRTQKLIMKTDYQVLKSEFLNGFKSQHTKESYNYALKEFEVYCRSYGLQSPIAATPSIIDNWIIEQRSKDKAPATIRRNAAAVSSFFSKVERNTNHEILNPVRGTKARPKNTPVRKNKFYSMGTIDAGRLDLITKDMQRIIDHENNAELKAIISCMIYRGLRCGAFEHMTIYGDQFRTISKGEETKGVLPAVCLKYINAAGVKHSDPFCTWSSNRIKQAIKNHVKKLYESGKINYKYSAHDFRHYFSLCVYNKDPDIYKLSKLLNHSGIAVTERYLKGLNVEL